MFVLVFVPSVVLGVEPDEFELVGSAFIAAGARSTFKHLELFGGIGSASPALLTGGEFELTGDFSFVALAAECKADSDTDGDGDVDLADVLVFLSCFGVDLAVDSDCCRSDLDGDNDVDLADLITLQTSFTMTP